MLKKSLEQQQREQNIKRADEMDKEFGVCDSCEFETVLVKEVGLCCFGEADTINGNW